MAIRLKDLAKIVGVSPATVSLALNGSELVNDETRQRVLDTAREYGYVPNTYARRLSMRRSGMLGLVIPDIENVYYASLVRMINKHAIQAGYGLSIAISDNSLALEDKIVTDMISSRVEGVVCVPANLPDGGKKSFARLCDAGIPAVCSTTILEGVGMPSVLCGLREGMRELALYLFERGCRRPAYITGPAGVYALDIRREGFLDAVREYGADRGATGVKPPSDATGTIDATGMIDATGIINASVIEVAEVTYAAACEAAERIVAGGKHDSVICVNDMMALGAVNTFNRHGLVIPRDMSVGGFDDVVFAEASPAPLTTVRQDLDGIARESVALLLRLIAGEKPADIGNRVLPPKLVVRQSTR